MDRGLLKVLTAIIAAGLAPQFNDLNDDVLVQRSEKIARMIEASIGPEDVE